MLQYLLNLGLLRLLQAFFQAIYAQKIKLNIYIVISSINHDST
jgi:hypothetical protein